MSAPNEWPRHAPKRQNDTGDAPARPRAASPAARARKARLAADSLGRRPCEPSGGAIDPRANLASLAICCWISGVFGNPWGVKCVRRVFIPTALWVFSRRIGHANTQLRDLVIDTAWRGHNTLLIRKSGSISARNGPKRRKRKKKKKKKKYIKLDSHLRGVIEH